MLYLSLLADLEWIEENATFVFIHFSCFTHLYLNLIEAILILLFTMEHDFAVEC